MPNWCMNGLVLEHKDPAMIKRAETAMQRGQFFNEYLPVPQDLLETVAGAYADDAANQQLQEQQATNIAMYGYANWYEFCVDSWGTKWEATDIDVSVNNENILTAAFDTAWGPPTGVYDRLVELGYIVEAKFYEPGMGFVGTYDNESGETSIDITDATSDNVRELVGEELDDYFAISENMSEWES